MTIVDNDSRPEQRELLREGCPPRSGWSLTRRTSATAARPTGPCATARGSWSASATPTCCPGRSAAAGAGRAATEPRAGMVGPVFGGDDRPLPRRTAGHGNDAGDGYSPAPSASAPAAEPGARRGRRGRPALRRLLRRSAARPGSGRAASTRASSSGTRTSTWPSDCTTPATATSSPARPASAMPGPSRSCRSTAASSRRSGCPRSRDTSGSLTRVAPLARPLLR